ncbi:hypothetical protein C8Q77DRAFT_1197631 [Trametes polyzona]|nr:hypothetical protein C8Q77DRAFT_1197631 [Trametes polyzona]
MSRAHQLLLKKLCHNDDTLERAKAVLHTASIKTAPGSGYELGQGASGLPAICAYIAAEELGDTDVTEQIAQVASCLKPKVFKTTLNTVKGALAEAARSAATASPTKHKTTTRMITYEALLTEKKFGRKALVSRWMQDAERTLLENQKTRRKFGNLDAVTIAVFCWTCQLMGAGKKVDAQALLGMYGVTSKQFSDITDALHELCGETAKKIEEQVASLKASRSPTKPAPAASSPVKPSASAVKASSQVTLPPAIVPPTPSKTATLTRSPSKSALRAPSADLSPRKTPSHKRKVAFDGPIAEADEDEFDALATPSKRQKFSSPIKELPSTTTTPRRTSRLAHDGGQDNSAEQDTPASSSRDTLDLLRHAARGSVAGSVPSTPRRSRVASQPSSTHSARSVRSGSGRSQPTTPTRRKPALPTVHEDEERPVRRRYRPAFADTQQWLRGDARLERSLKPWAERWRELMGRCGGDIWEAARAAGDDRRRLQGSVVDVAS